MKLFDVDWAGVLRDLQRWDALELPTRRLALDLLKTTGHVPAALFGARLDALVAGGLAQRDTSARRVMVPDAARALVKVLRAMDRHRVFDEPSPTALVKYLEEHFSSAEIARLGGQQLGRGAIVSRAGLATRLAYEGWPGDLLAAESDCELGQWATERGAVLTIPPDASLELLRALQQLARTLLAEPDGVPVRELAARTVDEELPALADALHAGLELAVVFAGLREHDLEPLVGLWPPASRALARGPIRPPATVEPVERFTLASLMEDMTTVLAAVVAEPLRLRATDFAVFARARKLVEARLVTLPSWAAALVKSEEAWRVDSAAHELQRAGFARVRHVDDAPYLEPTSAGTRWLAGAAHERLTALVQPIRAARETNPRGAYDEAHGVSFFPYSLPYLQTPKTINLRAALASTLIRAGETFVPLESFLEHATTVANPFLTALDSPEGRADLRFGFYIGGDPREVYGHVWRDMLLQFLVHRLVVLGGATIGRTAEDELCFALTDVGRYLLGTTDRFEYGSGEAGGVIVQPNFDVVFLDAAPVVEASIARFAERAGPAPGLTFRITRASVLAAAEAGATAEDVLGVLRDASTKPVPKNVEREITGWVAAVRRARIRTAELIECADADAAASIRALLGAKLTELTPLLFELPEMTPSDRTAILRRLRAGGVFLDLGTPHSRGGGPRPRRPSARNSWR